MASMAFLIVMVKLREKLTRAAVLASSVRARSRSLHLLTRSVCAGDADRLVEQAGPGRLDRGGLGA